jgi:two-component system response regulator RegA
VAARAQRETSDAAAGWELPTGGPTARAQHGVLVLDLDCSGRRQLAADLGARNFAVTVSEAADEGVSLALRLCPALVILELRLRGGASGLEVLSELRPQLPATNFVVLTAYGSVASAVRAMQLGATNYLCKPASPLALLRAADPAAANDFSAGAGDPEASLTLDEAIWEHIHQTIEASGSLAEAARRLGLWRQSLKRMIAKYRPSRALLAPCADGRAAK